jgi:hypothetical protein
MQPIQTNWNVYHDAFSKSDAELADIDDPLQYRTGLSDTHFTQFHKAWREARQGKASTEYTYIRTTQQMMTDAMVGFDDEEKARHYQDIQAQLDLMQAQKSPDGKRVVLSDDDVRQTIANYFADYNKPGLFGQSKFRLGDIEDASDVPKSDAEAIKAEYAKRGLREPSDRQIVDAYRRKLMMQRRGAMAIGSTPIPVSPLTDDVAP